jgi:hypothetical protein
MNFLLKNDIGIDLSGNLQVTAYLGLFHKGRPFLYHYVKNLKKGDILKCFHCNTAISRVEIF